MRGEFQRLGDDVLLSPPPPPPRALSARSYYGGVGGGSGGGEGGWREPGEGVFFLRRSECVWNMLENSFSIYGLVRIRIQASRRGLLRSCWGKVGGIVPGS
jgi:hypothetical protein